MTQADHASQVDRGLVIGNRAYWAVVAAALLGVLLFGGLTGTSSGLEATSPWNSRSIQQVPVWLKIWLAGIVGPTFYLSLLFVWRHGPARWVLGAFLVSHIPIFFDLGPITVGFVGWLHLVCWTPALLALTRERPGLSLASPYGLWVNVAVFVLFVSLVFDAISAGESLST